MDTTEIVLHLLDGNYLIAKSEQIVDLSEIQKQQFINLSWDDGYFSYIYHVESYSQIWCMGIKQLSCLIAPLLVRRLGISRC